MEIKHNENLAKYTTVKIGGVAENFYIPQNTDELSSLLTNIRDEKKYVLSGGSNLLINDKKVFKNVIYMSLLDTDIKNNGNGNFYCGASVRIQKFIKTINEAGYGGIEYLNSVPALVGGMIYMNAGIGVDSDCISTYIVNVYVIDKDNGKKVCFNKQDCEFSRRKSVFQNEKYIIVGADFCFPKQDIEISNAKINFRKQKTKEVLDLSGGNFGSVFSIGSNKIMQMFKILHPKVGGMGYSRKVTNYLINYGNGTYKQAMLLINICVLIHKVLFRKIRLEVKVWK